MTTMKFIATLEGVVHEVVVDNHDALDGLYTVLVDGRNFNVDARSMPSSIVSALINNKSYDVDLDRENSADTLDGKLAVRVRGRVVRLEILEERRKKMKESQQVKFARDGLVEVRSPMPGKVLRHLVKVGETVKEGQGLVVVEAMKMENELQSPKEGVVKEIISTIGMPVDTGTCLITIE